MSPAAGDDDDSAGPSPWETLSSEIVADARIFRVRRKHCRHPRRDCPADFFVIDSSDWVNVVAVTTAGEIVLVTQYRFGVEAHSLEVPGGVMEKGEDAITAARRELEEETGFAGGEARVLAVVHPNPAIQDNRCHLVLIEGVRLDAKRAWDEHEELATTILPAEEVFALARNGGITHALVLNALFFFESEWRRRRAGHV
jgi:8-oxo-dGTP pyrophosphatase MutT (NUDIX family)